MSDDFERRWGMVCVARDAASKPDTSLPEWAIEAARTIAVDMNDRRGLHLHDVGDVTREEIIRTFAGIMELVHLNMQGR